MSWKIRGNFSNESQYVMNKMKEKQLIIIGAGPGGYRAAFMASDLGLDVTLIDPEINPGGVCLYRGCIPTKALLHISKVRHFALEASSMGLHFGHPEIKIGEIRQWKNQVVEKLTGGLGQIVKSRKINYLRGYAHFLDSNTIEFKGIENGKQKLRFRNAIIATGVKPRQLPELKFEDEGIMDAEEALDLNDLPNSLLIIGGGYIGLEMAFIYNALGVKVTLVELTGGFMPGMDHDLTKEFERSTKHLFEEVHFETTVSEVYRNESGWHVTLQKKDGNITNKQFDKVLLAIGEAPDHSNLGLDNTRVETDQHGFIKVDHQLHTNDPDILAIGDVTGEPMLAHKAFYEGRLAAEVLAGKNHVNDARVIPAVMHTHPEMAACGLSEIKAKEEDLPHRIVKFPWSASGRARAMNESRGFTKLIIHPENERILGAATIGKDAGDLISELALAIEMSATATDLGYTIHPHPTLSETIQESAEMFLGHPQHTIKKK